MPHSGDATKIKRPQVSQAVWLWANYLTSLSLSFFFCDPGMIKTPLNGIVKIKCEHVGDLLGTMPGSSSLPSQ